MHDDLWQLFAANGTPISGKGATRQECISNRSLTMGNAHIWFWKKDRDGLKIMLQKRGQTKDRPGWYHVSLGGHITVDETPLTAAIREAKEEMGLVIDPGWLYFVQTARNFPRSPHDIVHVYLYRLQGGETFTHDDG